MLKAILIILLMSISMLAQTDETKYRIYDAGGNPADFDRIIEAIGKMDVVFLGEQHDDRVAHLLQFEIFKTAFVKYGGQKPVVLSLEMFERDVQTVVDEYLKNLITEQHFLSSSRPWGNYQTDYRPLVEFAREKKLQVIAANAPRRYVNMVSRLGLDSLNQLSTEAKLWLAPLPFAEASPEYAKKFNELMGSMSDSNTPIRHTSLLASQTLWDATMAFSISEYLKRNKQALIINLNGSFHTEHRLGTVEHLLKYRPETRVLVVTMRYENDFKNFDKTRHTDLGDFVILTDAAEPRSRR